VETAHWPAIKKTRINIVRASQAGGEK